MSRVGRWLRWREEDLLSLPALQASRYFHGGKEDVILLATIFVPRFVVSYYDASIGLLAFSLLMWVTFPWAFVERVDRQVIRFERYVKRKYKSKEEQDMALKYVGKPYWWIRNSTKWFFMAGIFFLMDMILELVSQVSTFVVGSYGLPFWAGVLVLSIAMFEAYRTMQFVLFDFEIPEITYKHVAALASMLLVIAFLGSFNAVELIYVLPNITPILKAHGVVVLIYVTTILLSYVGSVLLMVERGKLGILASISARTMLAVILFVAPWLVLGIVVLTGS